MSTASLRDKAYPVEPEREPPPVSATLTRVEYDMRALGDVARGKANLTIDVLKDGWVRVPIPQAFWCRKPGWTANWFRSSLQPQRKSATSFRLCFRMPDALYFPWMLFCLSLLLQEMKAFHFLQRKRGHTRIHSAFPQWSRYPGHRRTFAGEN